MNEPVGYSGASVVEQSIGIKGGEQPAAKPSMQKGHTEGSYNKDVSSEIEKMQNMHNSKPMAGVSKDQD